MVSYVRNYSRKGINYNLEAKIIEKEEEKTDWITILLFILLFIVLILFVFTK